MFLVYYMEVCTIQGLHECGILWGLVCRSKHTYPEGKGGSGCWK